MTPFMKYSSLILALSLFFAIDGFAEENEISSATTCNKQENNKQEKKSNPSQMASAERKDPQGWSLDVGGQYTWMSFSTPPTFSGSTGGVEGKLTYQEPKAFFGQVRSTYNLGSLSSSVNSSHDYEWYSEVVGGYCFSIMPHWTISPYAGIGFDFLKDQKTAYSTISAITLHYRTYYALAGIESHYAWQNWLLGAEVDCFPVFDQFLEIGGLSGAAWKMDNRVGFEVRVPAAYKLLNGIWLELAPYYRLLSIGSSSVLSLPHRNLDQWGAFLALRFFL